MMNTEKPISAKEAAGMLGVIPRTVVRLVERGEIPGFKVGDVWRFYRSDIEKYIQAQMEQARQKSEQSGESSPASELDAHTQVEQEAKKS